MASKKTPITPAIRALNAAGVPFKPRLYKYEHRGGTKVAARELSVDEHATIKTLILKDQEGSPLLMLMHGDLEVSTKKLARVMGAKHIEPCEPAEANRHTGYQVGGISPFGVRKKMRVFVQQSILGLPVIYINGGKRGLLVEMSPQYLEPLLEPTAVDAAQNDQG